MCRDTQHTVRLKKINTFFRREGDLCCRIQMLRAMQPDVCLTLESNSLLDLFGLCAPNNVGGRNVKRCRPRPDLQTPLFGSIPLSEPDKMDEGRVQQAECSHRDRVITTIPSICTHPGFIAVSCFHLVIFPICLHVKHCSVFVCPVWGGRPFTVRERVCVRARARARA